MRGGGERRPSARPGRGAARKAALGERMGREGDAQSLYDDDASHYPRLPAARFWTPRANAENLVDRRAPEDADGVERGGLRRHALDAAKEGELTRAAQGASKVSTADALCHARELQWTPELVDVVEAVFQKMLARARRARSPSAETAQYRKLSLRVEGRLVADRTPIPRDGHQASRGGHHARGRPARRTTTCSTRSSTGTSVGYYVSPRAATWIAVQRAHRPRARQERAFRAPRPRWRWRRRGATPPPPPPPPPTAAYPVRSSRGGCRRVTVPFPAPAAAMSRGPPPPDRRRSNRAQPPPPGPPALRRRAGRGLRRGPRVETPERVPSSRSRGRQPACGAARRELGGT